MTEADRVIYEPTEIPSVVIDVHVYTDKAHGWLSVRINNKQFLQLPVAVRKGLIEHCAERYAEHRDALAVVTPALTKRTVKP